MTLPSATYTSPEIESHVFEVHPANPRYQTTDGQSTGPSPHVLNAGQIDVDKPSNPNRSENGELTALGQLRCHLTGLQDDVNEFLTNQMELAKRKKAKLQNSAVKEDERIEKEINELLDGNDNDQDV